MIKLGLTGSIGMGKSTTASMFSARGVPVYDADAAVHQVYAPGGAAVKAVSEAFPDVLDAQGGIDRSKLRERVVGDSEAMKRLEQIIHPIVSGLQVSFLEKAASQGAEIIVLDVPLLYETGGDKRVDYVVVVTAPEDVQRERVLARGQLTAAQLGEILTRQLPDREKRQRADFVIDTSLGLEYAEAQVDAVLRTLRSDVATAGVWSEDQKG
jgi:dephospho-CoA kinase